MSNNPTPLAHRVIIPAPYVPALHSDVRQSIAAAHARHPVSVVVRVTDPRKGGKV